MISAPKGGFFWGFWAHTTSSLEPVYENRVNKRTILRKIHDRSRPERWFRRPKNEQKTSRILSRIVTFRYDFHFNINTKRNWTHRPNLAKSNHWKTLCQYRERPPDAPRRMGRNDSALRLDNMMGWALQAKRFLPFKKYYSLHNNVAQCRLQRTFAPKNGPTKPMKIHVAHLIRPQQRTNAPQAFSSALQPDLIHVTELRLCML